MQKCHQPLSSTGCQFLHLLSINGESANAHACDKANQESERCKHSHGEPTGNRVHCPSCGGGAGGGDDAALEAGLYRGLLSLVKGARLHFL